VDTYLGSSAAYDHHAIFDPPIQVPPIGFPEDSAEILFMFPNPSHAAERYDALADALPLHLWGKCLAFGDDAIASCEDSNFGNAYRVAIRWIDIRSFTRTANTMDMWLTDFCIDFWTKW